MKDKSWLRGVWARCLLSAAGWAQIPPGYEGIIYLTNDAAFNYRPCINNRGQIVFAKQLVPQSDQTLEIYLWDNGVLSRLTNDNVRDTSPWINDTGDIVWSRGIGPGGSLEIVLYRNGQLTRLTNDSFWDYSPVINNQGLVAWSKLTGLGCEASDADIYLYDGSSVRRITFGGYSHQDPSLNDLGDLVWTRYNFCTYPWTSQIWMLSDGQLTALTDDQNEPQCPEITNDRVVVYYSSERPDWQARIYLWRDGATTLLTSWGAGPRTNRAGDVVFHRWHENLNSWQVWLYRFGQFWQITQSPFWNCEPDINEAGEIVWSAGPVFDSDVALLRRLARGDLNCDGLVNTFDIEPFVLGLTDPRMYRQVYSNCDYLLGDMNLDGRLNAFDIDPFVDALTGVFR